MPNNNSVQWLSALNSTSPPCAEGSTVSYNHRPSTYFFLARVANQIFDRAYGTPGHSSGSVPEAYPKKFNIYNWVNEWADKCETACVLQLMLLLLLILCEPIVMEQFKNLPLKFYLDP